MGHNSVGCMKATSRILKGGQKNIYSYGGGFEYKYLQPDWKPVSFHFTQTSHLFITLSKSATAKRAAEKHLVYCSTSTRASGGDKQLLRV